MAEKWCNDIVLDQPLIYIKAQTVAYYACSQQPADYLAATTTTSLGSIPLDLSAVALVTGDIDGRKLPIPGVAVTAAAAGDMQCVALVSVDTLLYVNPLDELLPVLIDDIVQLPSWDIEFGKPA